MKVHLIRAADFSAHTYQAVLQIVTSFPGPVNYVPSETEVQINQAIEQEISNRESFETGKQPPPLASIKMEHALENRSFSHRPPVEFPVKVQLATWDSLFDVCKSYRSMNRLPKEDLIILLTDTANEANWFVGMDQTTTHAFIHTADWHHYFEGLNERFPIAYEIAATVLRMSSLDSPATMQRIYHTEPRGCISDLCLHKKQIVLKMRTADICMDCMNFIASQDIDMRLVTQVVETFEGIRKNFLAIERTNFLKKPSRLLVKGYMHQLIFQDYGNLPLQLNPKQRAIYCFFLNHPEGVRLVDLVDHRQEIGELYHRFSNHGTLDKIEESLDLLLDPLESNLNETLSRIKRIVEKTV
ncbi:MAG: hypothetical protein ACKO5L_07145, partial [Bacteroidota bacterium]